LDDVALDQLALLAGADAQGVVGDAVDVAQRAGCGFVQDGDGVGSEDLLGGTGGAEASADVVGGILGGKRLDREPVG
jgi:hypothetical protein